MTGRAHLVLVVLTLGVLGFVLHLVRSGRLLAKYAMLWVTVGVGLVVLAAFPHLLEWSSARVGIYYPPAAFLLAATAFLFVLTVHFSWELSRLESRTGTLAEEVALLREKVARLADDRPVDNTRSADGDHAIDSATSRARAENGG